MKSQAFKLPSDMSHTDSLTGVRKRKKKNMDDMRATAYRKAMLDILMVQAVTGQLFGEAPAPAPAPMAPPPMDPAMMDPAMMGGAPPMPPMGMPPGMMG